MGNPQVFQGDPYLHLQKPTPAPRVQVLMGLGKGLSSAAHKGGGGGENTCLQGRRMRVLGIVPKHRKDALPACSCLQGKWKTWECHRNAIKIHLWLTFGCKRGGGVGNRVERVLEGKF